MSERLMHKAYVRPNLKFQASKSYTALRRVSHSCNVYASSYVALVLCHRNWPY